MKIIKSTEPYNREGEKWCNFACNMTCDNYTNWVEEFGYYDEECESECGDGGGSEDSDLNLIQQYCANHPYSIFCNWTWTPEKIIMAKQLICMAAPDWGFCSNTPETGCPDGKVMCIKNGVAQCSNVEDCDIDPDGDPETETDWTKIALIGGGVILLTVAMVMLLKKK